MPYPKEKSKPTQFKKGHDPRRNSTGLNKGSHWLKTDLDILLKTVGENQSTPYGQLLNKRIIKEAIENGNLGFAKMIYEYIEGKPVETIQGDIGVTGEIRHIANLPKELTEKEWEKQFKGK